ncbi:MAG: GntR family transcriptional regulator [Anaerolineales bacterium]|nr:GntR family transcriptional regulator [Anaerolineales bacterium]
MAETSLTHQQRAYDYVKRQIMEVGIKPGAFITDASIASEMDISRTPVREAFRRLEREGLLVYKARRGWKVYSLSLKDINEIFDLKVEIEGMVARQAAACRDQTLRNELKATLQRMHVAADNNDIEAWVNNDPWLHAIIFAMGGNQRARTIVENLNDQYHRVRVGFVARAERIQRSIIEHEAFVDAILSGDGETAEKLMREHQNLLRQELVHLLETMVMPFVEKGI